MMPGWAIRKRIDGCAGSSYMKSVALIREPKTGCVEKKKRGIAIAILRIGLPEGGFGARRKEDECLRQKAGRLKEGKEMFPSSCFIRWCCKREAAEAQ